MMELGNGIVDVQHEASVAGKYEMVITLGSADGKESVAESPYIVHIKPTQVRNHGQLLLRDTYDASPYRQGSSSNPATSAM